MDQVYEELHSTRIATQVECKSLFEKFSIPGNQNMYRPKESSNLSDLIATARDHIMEGKLNRQLAQTLRESTRTAFMSFGTLTEDQVEAFTLAAKLDEPRRSGSDISTYMGHRNGDSFLYLNPDDHLGHPRVWSRERNESAWRQVYSDLETTLAAVKSKTDVYVVCGVPGSGKTHWIRNHPWVFRNSIVVDASLPRARNRARLLALAKSYHAHVHAIHVQSPLDATLHQNSLRSVDQQVDESVLRMLFDEFEEPSQAEGFTSINVIYHDPSGSTNPSRERTSR